MDLVTTGDAEAPVAVPRRDAAASPWWLLLAPLLPGLGGLPYVGPWLLPLAAPLPLYAAFRQRVVARRYGSAWLLTMAWAVLLSAGTIALTELRPGATAFGILHGADYRAEMFRWIVNGTGLETTPGRFVPQQLLHLALFVALTVISAGYLGLTVGAYLLDYMSYFVGSFAHRSAPVSGALAAWVPWAVVRVASFVLLCVVLARPLLVRLTRSAAAAAPVEPELGAREWRLLALAAGGIVLDLATKTLLAPWWGHLLHGMLRR